MLLTRYFDIVIFRKYSCMCEREVDLRMYYFTYSFVKRSYVLISVKSISLSQPASWGVSLIDSRVALGHKGEVIVQLFDGKKILVFPHSRADSDIWVDLLQRAATRKIGNFYGVTGLIGMGSFAEVRIGYDKVSGDQVAIKVMKKNKRDTELMRSVECEMNFISKNIDHENIVKTYDVFDTRDNLFIVMEYMPGGMLYDILANEGQFSEKHGASIMRDLLEAVHCLHSYDIVHRDIKPENVLAVNKTFPLKVKLADFGLADFVLENSFGEKSTCGMYGTPFFVAPEVIRAETYTPAVDIWSLGVLAYNMLSGKLPFDGSNIKEVLRRVRSGRYDFPDSEWSEISEDAMNFISGLLELDPHKRLTARQALAHPWLNDKNLSERAITNDRSALGYDQRKLRMSSMAIDDVAALLDMDEDDDDSQGQGGGGGGHGSHSHNLHALTKLFPSRHSNARAHGSSPRSSARSPASSAGNAGRPPRPPAVQSVPRKESRAAPGSKTSNTSGSSFSYANNTSVASGAAKSFGSGSVELSEPAPVYSQTDILPPLHPLVASGSIPQASDSLSPEDLDPFADRYSYDQSRNSGHTRDSRYDHGQFDEQQHQILNQEYDSTGYQQDQIGGFEANPGLALPAILSVKEMRRQKEAAAAGIAPGSFGYRSRSNGISGKGDKHGDRHVPADEDSDDDLHDHLLTSRYVQ